MVTLPMNDLHLVPRAWATRALRWSILRPSWFAKGVAITLWWAYYPRRWQRAEARRYHQQTLADFQSGLLSADFVTQRVARCIRDSN